MTKRVPDPLVPLDRENLKLALLRGVTVSELARRSGLLQQTVHNLVKGDTARCRASVRAKLARALGVHEDWLSGEMIYPKKEKWERWSPAIQDMWRRIWTAKESNSEAVRSIADHVKGQHALVVEDLLDLYDLVDRIENDTVTATDAARFGIRSLKGNERLWQRRLWRAIGQLEGHVWFGMPMELADEIGVPHPQDWDYV